MRSALAESLNKWLEYYVGLAKAHKLLPQTTYLIFDDYDKNDTIYPRMKLEVKDLDILDQIWRAQSTVVLQIWANNERVRDVKLLSNFVYWLLVNYSLFIPVFEHNLVLEDATDTVDVQVLELGEKITSTAGSSSFLLQPSAADAARIPAPFTPIVEGSVILYQYDAVENLQGTEYVLDTDYTVNYQTGQITWLITPSITLLASDGKEIRCYYTHRVFNRYVKVLEGSLLEIPFNSPDEHNPGIIRTDFSFDVLY